MALELAANAREDCTVSGNTFDLNGAQDGAARFVTAIGLTTGTTGGSTLYCYCFDNDDQSVYEIMGMTYNAGPDTLTRDSTIIGSNGTSAVTFGTGNHTIYRCLTHFDMTPRSLKVIQKGSSEGTGLITDGVSTSYANACDFITVTPTSSSSNLYVTYYATGRVARNTAGEANICRIAQGYINSSSVNTEFSSQYNRAGSNLSDSDADKIHYFSSSRETKLTQSNLNASGVWRINLRYLSNTTQPFTLDNVSFFWEEVIS